MSKRINHEGGDIKLEESELDILRENALDDFGFFSRMLSNEEFWDDVFHRNLCNFIQETKSVDTAIIMPRGHLKTTIATKDQALWRATRDSSIRILVAGNTVDNASKTLIEIMGVVEGNNLYQTLFPEVIPLFSKTRWGNTAACLARDTEFPEATFEAAGVKTGVTRRHFDMIIEDDTVAPEKDSLGNENITPTREQIEKAVGFHKMSIPLLIDPGSSRRQIVGTRWSFFDIFAHIREEQKKNPNKIGRYYDIYDIPAIDPETGLPNYKRFSLETLASIERDMGSFSYNSLYLNNPFNSTSLFFRPEWTKYYDYNNLPEDGYDCITIDPADPPTGNSSQCNSAIVCCRWTKTGIYVRTYEAGRYTYQELIDKTFEMCRRFHVLRVRIEKDRYPHLKSGFELELAKRQKEAFECGKTPPSIIFENVSTRGRSKDMRITRLQPLFQNGFMYLREGMDQLEKELLEWPNGKFCDLVDALAWQILDNNLLPDFMGEVEVKKEEKKNHLEFSYDKIQSSMRGNRGHSLFQKQGFRLSEHLRSQFTSIN